MNLQQQERFYQTFARSRAAAVPKENETVTEVTNGLIVTRPAKKFEYLSPSTAEEQGPEIIELGGKSKAGSAFVQKNKLREIHNFIRSNGKY